jgi:hypothetical protein
MLGMLGALLAMVALSVRGLVESTIRKAIFPHSPVKTPDGPALHPIE